MAKSRASKGATIAAIDKAFDGAKGVVFANFAGLNVKATTDLRRKCRAAGVNYVVAKKTLLKLAFEKANVKDMNPRTLQGGLAVVFGYDDEVAAAKLLKEFAAANEALQFVGGLMPTADGWSYIDARGVKALASLPGKQELIGQVVGTIAAPLRGFVSVLNGNLQSLVQVLSAISAKA